MASTTWNRWVTPYSNYLWVGLFFWVLCSVAAAVYAAQSGLARLPTVVTWNEWLVAIILIPALLGVGARGTLRWAKWIAATVLGLDILVRAFFGLGWQPFL